jgi:poly(ADP-ribose) glycohydrolase
MPILFAGTTVPLLLRGSRSCLILTRRQCACFLAHSFFGSITASARRVENEKWAFRAAQLFFLEALPSALCFLNYFKLLGQNGIPAGSLTIEKLRFPRGFPPWHWEQDETPLCNIDFVDGSIEDSPADVHVDFANKFIGGGCLENDFAMEEILFAIKPEMIVSMALCSYMQDEEAIRISGALQYSPYTGYSHTFEFAGNYVGRRAGAAPIICAIDALQGCSKIQFVEGLVRRDLNKARIAFGGGNTVATGNWGCGAFGNDHTLKFIQQWLAASAAGVTRLCYHTYDKRASRLCLLVQGLKARAVCELWALVHNTIKGCFGPEAARNFRVCMEEAACRSVERCEAPAA